MAEFPIRIPKSSLAATEAGITGYLIEDGNRVEEGEPLYLLETEKVEEEIEAPVSGVVHWDDSIETMEPYEVGTQIGYIETDD